MTPWEPELRTHSGGDSAWRHSRDGSATGPGERTDNGRRSASADDGCEASYEGDAKVQISMRRSGDATIIDVAGDIDLMNSPEMRKVLLRELKEKPVARLAINLKGVKYMDSSGVASLVEGLKLSRQLGKKIVLFGLAPAIREVLRLSRLLSLFEVYDNEEQALAL
jgi:anti-sigma B factor antagonist